MRSGSPSFACLAAAALLAALAAIAAAGAGAGEPPAAPAAPRKPRGASREYRAAVATIEAMQKAKPASRSTGLYYENGGLENGAEMPEKGFGYRFAAPKRKTHCGSDAMVYGLIELAALLQERRPGSPWLSIGDISKPGGGKLDPHINHQDGCDVDLAFLYCTAKGEPADRSWQACDETGKAKGGGALFDAARNFEMLWLALESPYMGELDWIFVFDPLKKLVVEHGRELAKRNPKQADKIGKVTDDLEKLLRQPESSPHADHFHIRVKKIEPAESSAGSNEGEKK